MDQDLSGQQYTPDGSIQETLMDRCESLRNEQQLEVCLNTSPERKITADLKAGTEGEPFCQEL